MDATHFQIYKLSGVVAAFVISGFLQWAAPYQGNWKSIFRNWRTNFSLGLLGSLMMGLLCGGCVCIFSEQVRRAGFGLFHWLNVPLSFQVLLSLFVLDFVAYAMHRAYHFVPFLWRFHAVHHTDLVFDSSTAVRFHPGELVISLGVRMLIVATFGLPVWGLLIFEVVYALFNFFEHGDIRLPRKFEDHWNALFISPALHRKHHSHKGLELNSNFGTIFSFWDRELKTYREANSLENIEVGLKEGDENRGLWKLLTLPTGMRSNERRPPPQG